jgi:hypothetical protein
LVSGPARLVTLLYPARPGQTCPVSAVSAEQDVWSTAMRLTLAGGKTIDLDESSYPF